MKHFVTRELDEHGATMESIASVRSHLRVMNPRVGNANSSYRLAKGEHMRYACLAMARLGQPVSEYPYTNSDGTPRLVGPYVTHAVQDVLKGMDTSEADRHLVGQYASLINVATRGL